MNRWADDTRNWLLGIVLLFGLSLQAEETPDYSVYGRLLETYVRDEGVHYNKWMENGEDVDALREFTEILGQTDIDVLSEADQKALYINLYNAAMLCAVLEKYPTSSVKTMGTVPFSVFKKDFIHFADRKISLDEIEKGILHSFYG